MATENRELNIDFGLNVVFNGKKYKLVMSHSQDEYPIGGLLCEYMRIVPTDIKDLILRCNGLEKMGSEENYAETMMQFSTMLYEDFPPVIGTLVVMEFMTAAEDWFKAVRENKSVKFLKMLKEGHKAVREIAFENTNIKEFGGETVLQLLLTCFYLFSEKYLGVKSLFKSILESNQNNEKTVHLWEMLISMYGEHMDIQRVDFRIILTENGFESLYTFKTSVSMVLFEIAHIIDEPIKIVKCKNCGHYFIPEGRSDAIYCSYKLRNNKEKTCRDVGAQNARVEKEKNDIATKAYRKLYMRYKMMIKRHPENEEILEAFQKLTSEVKGFRNKLEQGEIDIKEFMAWLEHYEKKGN